MDISHYTYTGKYTAKRNSTVAPQNAKQIVTLRRNKLREISLLMFDIFEN